jgi:hypothetical protein
MLDLQGFWCKQDTPKKLEAYECIYRRYFWLSGLMIELSLAIMEGEE